MVFVPEHLGGKHFCRLFVLLTYFWEKVTSSRKKSDADYDTGYWNFAGSSRHWVRV
jgi:hypothetical protein